MFRNFQTQSLQETGKTLKEKRKEYVIYSIICHDVGGWGQKTACCLQIPASAAGLKINIVDKGFCPLFGRLFSEV